MLVEIPDPEVILGVIAAFLIGLGGLYLFFKVRPFIKSNSDINFIDNKYILTANKDIKSDNEILIDYDKLHKKYSFIGFSQPNYKKC